MIMRHAVITCNTDRVVLTGVSSEPSVLKRNFNHSLYLNISQLLTVMAPTLSSGKAALLAKNDNDVVIVAAVRSAMTKVRFDGFSSRFLC
jgi:hypothetical protein